MPHDSTALRQEPKWYIAADIKHTISFLLKSLSLKLSPLRYNLLNKQSCFGMDCHVSPHPKEAALGNGD